MHVLELVGAVCGSILSIAGVVILLRRIARWGAAVVHWLASIDRRFATVTEVIQQHTQDLNEQRRRIRRLEEGRGR